MNLDQLVTHLRKINVSVGLKDERLFISDSNKKLTPELRSALLAHKQALVDRLRAKQRIPQEPTGPVELSPVQASFLGGPIRKRYVLPARYELRQRIDSRHLRNAIARIVEHHDGLRTRFQREGERWKAFIPPMEEDLIDEIFQLVDLAPYDSARQAAIIAHDWHDVRAQIDFTKGINLKCVLYDKGLGSPQYIQLFGHHLVIDGEGMRIMLEDLLSLCHQSMTGEKLTLPAKTAPVRQVFQRIHDASQSSEILAEVPYWESLPWEKIGGVPRDYPDSDNRNTYDSTRQHSASLGADSTSLLLEGLLSIKATPHDAILLALCNATTRWSGAHLARLQSGSANGITSLYAGDLDCSRTIAWFTGGRAFVLAKPTAPDPVAQLQQVRGQVDLIPNSGIGFEVLLKKGRIPELEKRIKISSPREIIFNYFGVKDESAANHPLVSPIQAPPEERIHHQDYHCQRELVFFMGFSVEKRKLIARCDYSSNLHRRGSIERYLSDILSELENLASALASKTASHSPHFA